MGMEYRLATIADHQHGVEAVSRPLFPDVTRQNNPLNTAILNSAMNPTAAKMLNGVTELAMCENIGV
jgi:hypothetical protein